MRLGIYEDCLGRNSPECSTDDAEGKWPLVQGEKILLSDPVEVGGLWVREDRASI